MGITQDFLARVFMSLQRLANEQLLVTRARHVATETEERCDVDAIHV